RSRDLRVSHQDRMGIGRAIARPGSARTQAGVRYATCARAQLSRVVYRSDRPDQSVRGGRSSRARRVRLAPVDVEHLESGTGAAGLAAPEDPHLRSADQCDAETLSAIHRSAGLQAMEVLPRARTMDAAASRVRAARVSFVNSQFPIPNSQEGRSFGI